jgi:hypothetical protein
VKRNLKIVLLVFIILVCLAPTSFFAIFIAGKLYRWYNPYLDQELAGPTTTTSQWLEIVPKSPLRVERQRHMIALDLDKSISTEREGSRLVLPDGSIVRPQVELVGNDGKTYELKVPSLFLSNTGEILAYFSGDDLPKDKTYIKVRIRSDRPVRCNRIFWRNYNLWDAESPF